MPKVRPIIIATRGSALALAQANLILGQCRKAFPEDAFELKIMKTTGDKMLTASLSQSGKSLPKGLFTKELETALLEGKADLAVHSLKDLPTELPTGLKLGAVSRRADVRDVLIYRQADWKGKKNTQTLRDLKPGAKIGTSSPRRRAQLWVQQPQLEVVEIRGNIITRLKKLAAGKDLDGMLLAAAGLGRMGFQITSDHKLAGDLVPPGLCVTVLELDTMLPCVGQAALGIEVRENDPRIDRVCGALNDADTEKCVTAERAFLLAMGGGCSSPVGAYAQVVNGQLNMKAISFYDTPARRAEGKGDPKKATELGQKLAAELRPAGK